jgi:hypothetical protein
MTTSIEENKAVMRQVETPLNKSGGEAARPRSPNNANAGPTKAEESLNIHGAPYKDRRK